MNHKKSTLLLAGTLLSAGAYNTFKLAFGKGGTQDFTKKDYTTLGYLFVLSAFTAYTSSLLGDSSSKAVEEHKADLIDTASKTIKGKIFK